MPTPQSLGLPEKFTEWRPNQYEAIEAVVNSRLFAYLLDAPTGVGKSLIAIAVHKLTRKQTIYITRTKQLQDQLLNDFPEIVKTVKGRENYACAKVPKDFPSFTAAECTDTEKNPCELKGSCEYRIAKAEALASPIVVLNSSYYLTEVNGPAYFDGAELLIIDEVDSIEGDLMSYIQFEVNGKQLERFGIDPPLKPNDLQSWAEWLTDIKPILNARITSLRSTLEETDIKYYTPKELGMAKTVTRLERLRDKVNFLNREVNAANWIFGYKEEKEQWYCSFKPIMVDRYSSRFLWEHCRSVLGMSATIFMPNIVARNIGLDDYEYSSLSSPFPVENRRIYYCPTANLTKKTMDVELPKLLEGVLAILNKYPEDKILIHTVSYKIRDYLLNNLPKGRIMTHSREDRATKLEELKESPEPLVMLSPSFDRGVDLPNDECRVIIICKVPFPDLGDPQIEKRVKLPGGWQWYSVKVAQTLVQMSGRGVRSDKDYCSTYILDKQFGRFVMRMRNTLPKWWLNAVVRKEVQQ